MIHVINWGENDVGIISTSEADLLKLPDQQVVYANRADKYICPSDELRLKQLRLHIAPNISSQASEVLLVICDLTLGWATNEIELGAESFNDGVVYETVIEEMINLPPEKVKLALDELLGLGFIQHCPDGGQVSDGFSLFSICWPSIYAAVIRFSHI